MHSGVEELLIIQVSAIEHWAYCPRQCALIHVDQIFEENIFTIRGRLAHEIVDEPEAVWRPGVRIEYALPLWSDSLGLSGKADSVEFHDDGTVYPVERKLGKKRQRKPDDMQLCAQALCLEEMLEVRIEKGAILSHKSRRRREVEFTQDLRSETIQAISAIRELIRSGALPDPVYDKRCADCSLVDVCYPDIASRSGDFRQLLLQLFRIEEGRP